MHEKSRSAAHLGWLLRVQVEGAWSLGSLMHDIDAGGEFVGGGGKRPDVGNALFGWIVVSFYLPRVS